jgi:hypothetical protein
MMGIHFGLPLAVQNSLSGVTGSSRMRLPVA